MLELGRPSGVITPVQFDEFAEAKNRWYFDTLDVRTDPSQHPDFRRIVGMGESAIPLILEELKIRPSLLYVALEAITGENPVPETGSDSLEEISEIWQRWGEQNRSIAPRDEVLVFG